jgi:hypothetical protein
MQNGCQGRIDLLKSLKAQHKSWLKMPKLCKDIVVWNLMQDGCTGCGTVVCRLAEQGVDTVHPG